MSDTVLKWIAEELLGWESTGIGSSLPWWDPANHRFRGEHDLQSWHGVELVVEEMERRGKLDEKLLTRFRWRLEETDLESTPWWHLPIPEKWHHVFAAARKAVEER